MRSTTARSQVANIQPTGYITAANASDFQQSLREIVRSPEHSSFLVDMHQVEFLDSAGLMALVSAFRFAQSLGKQFSFCSLAPSVRIIFEVTQLDKVFEIFATRADFEASLQENYLSDAA